MSLRGYTSVLHKLYHKPVKRFQTKSNGYRDVQHTGTKHTNKKEL